MTTATAVDRLLEALAVAVRRDEGLEEFVSQLLLGSRIAQMRGRLDQANALVAVAEVALSVADDHDPLLQESK